LGAFHLTANDGRHSEREQSVESGQSLACGPHTQRAERSRNASALSCLVSTIPLRGCRSHLPLCRNCRSVANRIESYFAVLPLVDNQSAFWSLVHNGTTERRFQQFRSRAQRQQQLRRQRQNGTLETRHHAVLQHGTQVIVAVGHIVRHINSA